MVIEEAPQSKAYSGYVACSSHCARSQSYLSVFPVGHCTWLICGYRTKYVATLWRNEILATIELGDCTNRISSTFVCNYCVVYTIHTRLASDRTTIASTMIKFYQYLGDISLIRGFDAGSSNLGVLPPYTRDPNSPL